MGVGAAIALGVAGAAIGAGGAYMASKGSGQERSLGGELSSMPVGMYADQLNQMADAEFDLRERTAWQSLEMLPFFGHAAREQQRLSNKQGLRWYPKWAKAEREQTRLQREEDYANVSDLGPKYAKIFEQISPLYAKLDEELGSRDTRLLDALRADALEEMQLGTAIGADEARTIEQATRAAYADRGMERSNASLVSEVLNREGAGRARQNERRGYGINVANLEEASGSNRINQLIAGANARLSPILGAVGTRSPVNPTVYAGPASLAMGPQQSAAVLSSGPTMGQMAGAISPLYGYGADVYNTNFNAAESRALNAANALTAVGGGLMSAGGGMYGSAMKYGGGGGGAIV